MIDLNSGRQEGIREFTIREAGEFSFRQSFDSEVRRLAAEKLGSHSLARFTNVRMPDTLISDDIFLVRAFLSNYPRVIVKVPGPDSVSVFADSFTPEQLSMSLSQSSLRFQEYVPGITVRTYIWGDSVFNAEVCRTFNKQSGKLAETRRFVQVPDEQEMFSLLLCECLHTECAILEWRRDHQNNYYFLKLKANSCFRFNENHQFPAGKPSRRELVHLV